MDNIFDCRLFHLDRLEAAQGISVLNDNYKIALNPEDQVKRCAEMKSAINKLIVFNQRCFEGTTQAVFGALFKTRSEYINLHCKDPASSEFKEYLEAFKCIAEKSFDEVREAEKKTIESFADVLFSEGDDITDNLQHACCRVSEAKRVFVGATKEKCDEYKEAYSNYMDSYTNKSIPMLCPDELECDKLQALDVDRSVVRPQFKSLLMVVYRLLNGY